MVKAEVSAEEGGATNVKRASQETIHRSKLWSTINSAVVVLGAFIQHHEWQCRLYSPTDVDTVCTATRNCWHDTQLSCSVVQLDSECWLWS